MLADITITNIPTLTGIMGVMAIVITRLLGLDTAEAIEAVIRLMGDIMAVVMVVIEVGTAAAIMAAVLGAFAEATDKNDNIFNGTRDCIRENLTVTTRLKDWNF